MKLSDPTTSAGSFKPVIAGQRVYVWVLTSCTLLIAAMILWPLNVKQFQSTSTFRLQYDPSSGLNKVEVSRLVLGSIRNLTDSDSLKDILSEIQAKRQLESSLLAAGDYQAIRESLKIQNRPGDSSNSVEFRCTLIGKGTPDEIEFVNAIVSRSVARLTAESIHDSAELAIEQLASDFQAYQSDILSTNQQVIETTIGQISAAHHGVQIVTNDLNLFVNSARQPTEDNVVNPRWTALENEIASLKNEKLRLINEQGFSPYHPSLTAVQNQIETLTRQQDQIPKYRINTAPSKSDSSVIQNQFISESTATPVSVSVSKIIEEIKSIDLTSPRDQLHQVYQQLDNDRESLATIRQRLAERAKNTIVGEAALGFDRLVLGKTSHPLGGTPGRNTFVLLCFSAAALATVITLNFEPAARKRRFRNLHQLESSLTLPVIGQFPMRERPQKALTLTQRVAFLAVRVCEWLLLAFLVVFICAALINSEVITALLENPFDAITRIVWMIAPQN